jgi:hypothetical protein
LPKRDVFNYILKIFWRSGKSAPGKLTPWGQGFIRKIGKGLPKKAGIRFRPNFPSCLGFGTPGRDSKKLNKTSIFLNVFQGILESIR